MLHYAPSPICSSIYLIAEENAIACFRCNACKERSSSVSFKIRPLRGGSRLNFSLRRNGGPRSWTLPSAPLSHLGHTEILAPPAQNETSAAGKRRAFAQGAPPGDLPQMRRVESPQAWVPAGPCWPAGAGGPGEDISGKRAQRPNSVVIRQFRPTKTAQHRLSGHLDPVPHFRGHSTPVQAGQSPQKNPLQMHLQYAVRQGFPAGPGN